MVLEALELLERREVWVAVVEVGNQPNHYLPIGGVVEERTATGAIFREWPASAVHHGAGFVFFGINLPQFFDAEAVVLWIAIRIQLETFDEFFAQVATTTFGKQGITAAQFDARFEAWLLFTILIPTHVAGNDTFYLPRLVDDQIRRRITGKDIDPGLLRLLAQPATEVAQTGDIVALVVHGAWHQHVGHTDRTGRAGEEHDPIFRYRRIEWRALLPPVGKEFGQGAAFEYRT